MIRVNNFIIIQVQKQLRLRNRKPYKNSKHMINQATIMDNNNSIPSSPSSHMTLSNIKSIGISTIRTTLDINSSLYLRTSKPMRLLRKIQRQMRQYQLQLQIQIIPQQLIQMPMQTMITNSTTANSKHTISSIMPSNKQEQPIQQRLPTTSSTMLLNSKCSLSHHRQGQRVRNLQSLINEGCR